MTVESVTAEVALALEAAERRLGYAGDLWHDQGNLMRAEADWIVASQCRKARAKLEAASKPVSRLASVAGAFRLQFNPHDLPEGAFQLWESLGNEIERATS